MNWMKNIDQDLILFMAVKDMGVMTGACLGRRPFRTQELTLREDLPAGILVIARDGRIIKQTKEH
jgi:hypothetical protein